MRNRVMRAFFIYALIIAATLGFCEVVLAIRDPSVLRNLDVAEKNLIYEYDAELGWYPKRNFATTFKATRTISVHSNDLGFRDRRFRRNGKKVILVLGDSFVWGYDVEQNERFTELLQVSLPNLRVLNAGVSGYGTDQEYLLLKRIWREVKPDVVLLIFCTNNDHLDNSTNNRYGGYYKPYFSVSSHKFEGIPAPRTELHFSSENWLLRNSRLARLVVSLWSSIIDKGPPIIQEPDPSDYLVGMMQQFVQSHGAKFAVGLQDQDPALEPYLRAHGVPYTTFHDAARLVYPSNGKHWTPQGQKQVASRLRSLLVELGYPSED